MRLRRPLVSVDSDVGSLQAAGDGFFIQDRLPLALEAYEDAVGKLRDGEEEEKEAKLAGLLCRKSVVLCQLGQYESAVEMAEQACQMDPTESFGWYRLGLAKEKLKQWEEAAVAFERAAEAEEKDEEPEKGVLRFKNLAMKNRAKVEGMKLKEVGVAKKPEVALNGNAVDPNSVPTPDAGFKLPDVSEDSRDPDEGRVAHPAVRREWFQNQDRVVLTIFAKNVEREKSEVNFTANSVQVSLCRPDEPEYQMRLKLFDAIEMSDCRVDFSPYKVEISMRKASKGTWPRYDIDNSSSAVASQGRRKNWDDILDEGDDAETSGDPLQQMFQKIYADADEDTRRAMNKSFLESGGKVLSTNWKEVAEKKVEYKESS